MILQGSVLSMEEKELIHSNSIKILEEIGIRFPGEQALEILESGGAKIDKEKQVAYLSEEMVKEALKKVPKEFILGARNQAYDFRMPSSYSAYNLDGTGVNTLDFLTGKRRSSVIQDVADAAKVFEEIELGTVLWPPVSASDVAPEARSVIGTGTSFIHCSKHVQDEVKNIKEVPYVMEMAKAILGDMDRVKERKIYSVTYCTVAPLCHDGEMMEATMELSRYGAPILVYPMPACGTTGPASLYSTLATANAEALSAIVLFQLTSPGTPLIFGSALGVVNVRSGMFLEGASETALLMTAMTEMGKYYGMPTTTAGCLTDAKLPGMQSALEKTLTTLPLVLAETDLVQGVGLIESSMTLSLEHIIIDSEIAHLCKRMKEGIDIREEKNYFDDIKAVGPGGHFLKQKNTRKAFRSEEFYHAAICDRNSYDEWEALGSKDMFAVAHEKVQNILNSEIKNPLPHDTVKIIREIMEEASRKLCE